MTQKKRLRVTLCGFIVVLPLKRLQTLLSMKNEHIERRSFQIVSGNEHAFGGELSWKEKVKCFNCGAKSDDP